MTASECEYESRSLVMVRLRCQVWCTVEYDLAPKHFLVPTTINSPHCHEFMVSRIFSVVTIFLNPLMDEFTVMEVF